MPIYEYVCPVCTRCFEELVRNSSEQVKCPTCGNEQVNRKLSACAIHGAGGSEQGSSSSGSSGGGCGSCSGGHCGCCH